MAGMKIGQVARAAGVAIDTIRYYERRGILPEPQRRPSGYRAYDARTVERLKLVRHLKDLGLSLDDASGLLDALADPRADCVRARPRIEAALRRVEVQLAALGLVRRRLRRALQRCALGTCDLVDRARRAGPGRGRPGP